MDALTASEIANADKQIAPLVAQIEGIRAALQARMIGKVLTKTGGRRYTIKVDRVDFYGGRLWMCGPVRTSRGNWHSKNRDSIRVGSTDYVIEDADAD